jgi:hypothetical protein
VIAWLQGNQAAATNQMMIAAQQKGAGGQA